jgi:hypothetical protein
MDISSRARGRSGKNDNRSKKDMVNFPTFNAMYPPIRARWVESTGESSGEGAFERISDDDIAKLASLKTLCDRLKFSAGWTTMSAWTWRVLIDPGGSVIYTDAEKLLLLNSARAQMSQKLVTDTATGANSGKAFHKKVEAWSRFENWALLSLHTF